MHFIIILAKNNNFPNFNQGHTYLRVLLFFIPESFSMGIKPPDFAVSMGSAYINNFSNTIYSMHPTFYGDLFANFSYFRSVFCSSYRSYIFKDRKIY